MIRSHATFTSAYKPLAVLAVSLTAFTMFGTTGYAQTISDKDVTIRTLHTFDNVQGSGPRANLLQAADGNFYGSAAAGGTAGYGILFKMTPDGQFKTQFAFNRNNGAYPNALTQATDGNFYGTTVEGGANFRGTVFRLTPAGKVKTLYSFSGAPGLNYPYGKLVQGPDGVLYGTTQGDERGGLLFKITLSGTLTPLHRFIGPDGSGENSFAGLTLGTDGSYYGVTTGSVFRLRPNGKFAVLHHFVYGDRHGDYPVGGLVEGADGALYGTTLYGGPSTDDAHPEGYGTIFKISKTGQYTTLHAFGPDLHGGNPYSGLTLGSDGNLYGTTFEGGFSTGSPGTVFQMTPEGVLTTLYKFDGSVHGGSPYGGVTFGTDGSLYGTTRNGGVTNGASGYGTIFKLTLP